jgi:hypothetical protein
MGCRIRMREPNVVYSNVSRCNDRQFLLKPNHHPRSPLVSWDTPPEALEPSNDIIPRPSTVNIIGSAFARAQKAHPVRLHWLECNLNHIHFGESETEEQLGNTARFYRAALSLVARQLNRVWEREGHLWSSRYRTEACADDGGAAQKLFYAMTNVVKDGLVEKVSGSPFFTTYGHLGRGEALRYWHIDHAGWWKAGGPRQKKHRLKDYLRWVELEVTLLPEWSQLPWHKVQALVRCSVREEEGRQDELRRAEGRLVMGVKALRAVDPRDRPREPKDAGRQPICHASDAEARREYEKRRREFEIEHRQASHDYLAGMWGREFPEGSYRPPLITIYTSSRL